MPQLVFEDGAGNRFVIPATLESQAPAAAPLPVVQVEATPVEEASQASDAAPVDALPQSAPAGQSPNPAPVEVAPVTPLPPSQPA